MALSLLIIAIVLLGTAAVPELTRLRSFQWFESWLRWLDEKLAPNGFWRAPSQQSEAAGGEGADQPIGAWFALAIAIGLPTAVLAALSYWLNQVLLGAFGFLSSLLVLYFSLGPRDLGEDLTELSHAFQPHRRLEAQRAFGVNDGVVRSSAALIQLVLAAALKRHFAPLFWFATFGAAGALGYRLCQLCADSDGLAFLPRQLRSVASRLEASLAWIPAQLMCAALALASDFDAVARAWSDHHERNGRGIFDLNLDFLASTVKACIDIDDVDELTDIAVPLDNAPLQHTQSLLSRITLTWLVAMAILVLAFYLA